jgi:glucose-1-phosphate cytidylyltransferase
MKVVLFCGGLGIRLRDYADNVPKPMVPIGYRPIIWHLMKYYAHFGHKDFVLCLGYRGDLIKQYFLNYEECVSNDFVLSQGGRKRELLNSDITDWRITFVETGLNANIGQRFKAVEPHVAGEELFLANYSDGLTDLVLPDQIAHFRQHDKVAGFLGVRPSMSYHFATTAEDGLVTGFHDIGQSGLRVNGGFFIFKQDIFRYLHDGHELVEEPFQQLIRDRQLLAYQYDGFFMAVDTAKDKKRIDDLYAGGNPPWEVWRKDAARPTSTRDPRPPAVESRRFVYAAPDA